MPEELVTITTVQSSNLRTYTIKDAKNQIIQCKFYDVELTRFEQKHFLTDFNYRWIALVESKTYVNRRILCKFDFQRIHGDVSWKHTLPIYNAVTSI